MGLYLLLIVGPVGFWVVGGAEDLHQVGFFLDRACAVLDEVRPLCAAFVMVVVSEMIVDKAHWKQLRTRPRNR